MPDENCRAADPPQRAGYRGDVACERLALCYWAGKPFILDFSNYGQKLRRHDPAGLAQALRRRAFSAIVSVRDKRYGAYNSRLPASYNRLIEANYRVRAILPARFSFSWVRPIPARLSTSSRP